MAVLLAALAHVGTHAPTTELLGNLELPVPWPRRRAWLCGQGEAVGRRQRSDPGARLSQRGCRGSPSCRSGPCLLLSYIQPGANGQHRRQSVPVVPAPVSGCPGAGGMWGGMEQGDSCGFLKEAAQTVDRSRFVFTGRLINSIRVICRSYDDCQKLLGCVKAAQFRKADSFLSGSESFSGSKLPHPGQVTDAVGLRGHPQESPGTRASPLSAHLSVLLRHNRLCFRSPARRLS